MMPRAWLLLLLVSGCGFADIVEDRVGTVDQDLSDVQERLAELELENAALRARVEDLEVGSGARGWILEDTTWHVPRDHPDLARAMDAALRVRVWPDSVLTIQLEDGEHFVDGPIDFNHPDGDRIQLLGNPNAPTSITVRFTDDAVRVSDGHALGGISGLMLVGQGGGTGISASNQARVTVDGTVRVRNFDVGLAASEGALIRASGVRLQGNRQGAYADGGALIVLDDATVTDSMGMAVEARDGGQIHAAGTTVRGANEGFVARAGSIWASETTVDSAKDVAFRASDGGRIVGDRATAVASGSGFEATGRGLLILDDATSNDNGVSVLLTGSSTAFLSELAFEAGDGKIRVYYRSTLFAPVVDDPSVWDGQLGLIYSP